MSNKDKVIYLFSIIISIISILIAFTCINNPLYSYLPLLPSLFFLVTAVYLFANIRITNSIIYLILYFGYMLRMTIIPIIMILGNFSSSLVNTIVLDEMPKALLVICYEFIVVFAFILFTYNKKTYDIKSIDNSKYDNIINLNSVFMKVVIIIIFVISILLLAKYPNLRYYFSFIIGKDSNTEWINEALMENTVPSIYRAVFYLLTNILRISIPLIILQWLNKFSNKKIAYYLSIIVILLTCSFVTSDRAFTIYIAIALLLILYYQYPNKRKNIIKLVAFSGMAFVSVIFTYSYNISSDKAFFEKLSSILQAYANGPVNVATALNLKTYNFTKFFPHIGNSISLVAYFFQKYTPISYIFNEIFYGKFGRNNHIIPLIGQGYYYFGIILSPLLHLIVLSTGIKLENIGKRTNNFCKKYMLTLGSIISAVVPIMYNFSIFINIMTSLFLPLYIIILISNKRRIINE